MAALGWLLNLGFAGGTASVPTEVTCQLGEVQVTGLAATVLSPDELTLGMVVVRGLNIDMSTPTDTNTWSPGAYGRTWYPGGTGRTWKV